MIAQSSSMCVMILVGAAIATSLVPATLVRSRSSVHTLSASRCRHRTSSRGGADLDRESDRASWTGCWPCGFSDVPIEMTFQGSTAAWSSESLDHSHSLRATILSSDFEVIMLAYVFVLFAVVTRLPFLPHPWNFTPVTAALLYFGARGSRRHLWLPLALLIASDLVLDKYVYAYPFSWDLLLTWAWYAAMLGLGTSLQQEFEAAANCRRGADWIGQFLSGQQFWGVGGDQHVSPRPSRA